MCCLITPQLPVLPESFFSSHSAWLPPRIRPDISVRGWLLDQGSLTRRVIDYCRQRQGQFQVLKLHGHIGRAHSHENCRLRLPTRSWSYIREVILFCDQNAVIYARTVIPLASLKGKHRRLKFLKNRPLGAYLFAQRDMQRDPLEISILHHHGKTLWARRSCFYLRQKPLLVYEVFLQPLSPC